ncbi:MAG: DUF2934 domain-containing protein [Steroidobacteraceae bacterium]
MDLNSAGNSSKRARSKAKPAAGNDVTTTPKEAAPRSRKAKPASAAEPVIEVTSITAIATPDGDELLGMIATAAYYIAEQRNFEPGHELEDWLAAERQIRTIHSLSG